VKVDGKEEEVTLDDLIRGYSLGKAGQKRFLEASEKEKRANSVLEAFKNDPRGAAAKALKEFGGVELRDMAIELLAEEHRGLMEEERIKSLSPEARELEELRKFKGQQEDAKKKADAEARTKSVEGAKQLITKAVINTLEQFPEQYRRNEFLASRAADIWAYALEHADELQARGVDVSPQMVAQAIAKETRGLMREMATHAKDEELDEYIAPAVKERLFKTLKAEAEKTAHPALTGQPQVRDPAQRSAETPKRLTQAQLFRRAYVKG